MKDNDIVVIGAARTPLGSFGGCFCDIQAYDLGAAAIKAALGRADVPADAISQVIYGNCRQAGNGPNPSRTAAVRGGVPISVPTATINMACPSGMKAVMLAALELQSGGSEIVVAGGMESMSTMPYLLKNVRWNGFKFGDKVLSDSWSDTVDPLCGYGMGTTAENLVEKNGISREAQDEYAVQSHAKAAWAQKEGLTKSEIVAYRLPSSRKFPEGELIEEDEAIRADTNMAALAKLKPVFKDNGSVTAGNACSMGDGACALVLTTRARAKALGKTPLFSILAAAQTAIDPSVMGDGPAYGVPLALKKAGMTLKDADFIEVNEAFAAQMLSNEMALGWDRAKVNAFGGAIALGHPTGMSGGRILIALDNILRHHGKEIGVAGICGGGGVTTAMVIRRES
jgi:acetyl-CoA C-acetyltransferase